MQSRAQAGRHHRCSIGDPMKARLIAIAMLLTGCIGARAQVAPAAAASDAKLVYDLRDSQTAQVFSDNQPTVHRSVASGEMSYLNGGAHKPLSLTYSGGDMWAIDGPSSGVGTFQHFLLSQSYIERQWSLTVSDDVSYLPQSPTTGFSGIPGVGSLPGLPGPPSQPILLESTRSVNNDAQATYSHTLENDKTIGISAGYTLLRFPDGEGLDINQLQVAPQLSWRLDPLNSLSLEYAFGYFTYPGSSFSMGTQSALFGFNRTWNRRLKTTVSVGPEWISSSEQVLVPSSSTLSGNAALDYQARPVSWSVHYYRTTSAGVGTSSQLGIHNDDASVLASRTVGRDLSVSASGTYSRSQGLTQSGVVNGAYGGVQAQQRLGQYFTLFANYTLIKQTSSLALASNAINGRSQVFGFGISYSPRDIRISKR
jgi:hypothetical protein